jgi:uncharacterized small protein (DUF1192 family)
MSGYDTTNKLPAKAQNDTYFFLKELEKEIAALREENERLKEEVEQWRVLANTALASLESSQLINEISERYEIPRPEGE